MAAPEFGHVLGLNHSDEAHQSVVAITNSRISNVEVPQNDDVAGVRARVHVSPGPDAHTLVQSQNSYVMPKRSTRGVTMPTT